MKQKYNDKLKGNVEADETIVGRYTNKNKVRILAICEALLLATEKLEDDQTGESHMKF